MQHNQHQTQLDDFTFSHYPKPTNIKNKRKKHETNVFGGSKTTQPFEGAR
jgi:hypothetical protein